MSKARIHSYQYRLDEYIVGLLQAYPVVLQECLRGKLKGWKVCKFSLEEDLLSFSLQGNSKSKTIDNESLNVLVDQCLLESEEIIQRKWDEEHKKAKKHDSEDDHRLTHVTLYEHCEEAN